MRTRINKEKFKLMIWIIMLIGLVANGILQYQFMVSGVTNEQYYLGIYMALACLLIGGSIGMAIARNWFIEGIDDI